MLKRSGASSCLRRSTCTSTSYSEAACDNSVCIVIIPPYWYDIHLLYVRYSFLVVTVTVLVVIFRSQRWLLPCSGGVGRYMNIRDTVQQWWPTVNPATLLGTTTINSHTLDSPWTCSISPPPAYVIRCCPSPMDGCVNQRAQGRRRRRPVPGEDRPPDLALLLRHEADVAHEDRARFTRGRRKVRTGNRGGREGARERGRAVTGIVYGYILVQSLLGRWEMVRRGVQDYCTARYGTVQLQHK